MRAISFLLGAAVINVIYVSAGFGITFVFDFGGDGTAAFSAFSQSQKSKIISSRLWVLSGFDDFLHFVEKCVRNKQLMCSFIGFTAEVDNADVKLVAQNPFDCIEVKHFAIVSGNAEFLKETRNISNRAFALGEKLKCLFDDFGFCLVNLNGS